MQNDILNQLLTWQTGVFCIGIYFLTFLIRNFVEKVFFKYPSSSPTIFANQRATSTQFHKQYVAVGITPTRARYYWVEVVLPVLPILLGLAVALTARKYPIPDVFTVSNSARGFYGMAMGGFSGLAYRIVKTMAKKQFGVDVSMSPGPSGLEEPVAPPPQDRVPQDPPDAAA